jgi:transcriptional regulator with PAS, ATPase and Fis domain
VNMSDSQLSLAASTPAVRSLYRQIDRAARSDAKVLITGESGTGKEVMARLIHERSRRRTSALTTVNCAGIPDSLLESELFGYRRGSFTGAVRDRQGVLEKAHGGTLFMDEVGEMSGRMQGLLLRFLETGEIQPLGSESAGRHVDVRVIAATNRQLEHDVTSQSFRLDLYYRLKVVHVHIPPLRQRPDDILPLLDHFMTLYCERYQVPKRELSAPVIECLRSCSWPGNIRQLKNVAERLVVCAEDGPITIDELPLDLQDPLSVESDDRTAAAAEPARVDALFDRMINGGESFWLAVYGPFMLRDLTRDDVRLIVRKGLLKSHGNYMRMLQTFNMPADDYKRFLNFLRKHQCQLSFQPFRSDTPVHIVPAMEPPPARLAEAE